MDHLLPPSSSTPNTKIPKSILKKGASPAGDTGKSVRFSGVEEAKTETHPKTLKKKLRASSARVQFGSSMLGKLQRILKKSNFFDSLGNQETRHKVRKALRNGYDAVFQKQCGISDSITYTMEELNKYLGKDISGNTLLRSTDDRGFCKQIEDVLRSSLARLDKENDYKHILLDHANRELEILEREVVFDHVIGNIESFRPFFGNRRPTYEDLMKRQGEQVEYYKNELRPKLKNILIEAYSEYLSTGAKPNYKKIYKELEGVLRQGEYNKKEDVSFSDDSSTNSMLPEPEINQSRLISFMGKSINRLRDQYGVGWS